MVNARTIAIGTIGAVGAGLLVAKSMENKKYTAYKVSDDSTLYVNNDYRHMDEMTKLAYMMAGETFPEDSNAGFLEQTSGENRLLVALSHGTTRSFDGKVEEVCAYRDENNMPFLNIPEGAEEGDFSGYTLTNGKASHGPVGHSMDFSDCQMNEEHHEADTALYHDALDHAQDNFGLPKDRMLEEDRRELSVGSHVTSGVSGAWKSLGEHLKFNGGFLNCNLGRENAMLAYHDKAVGFGVDNQCAFLMKYKSSRTGEEHNYPFLRISGSQVPWDINNFGARDWQCNAGLAFGSNGKIDLGIFHLDLSGAFWNLFNDGPWITPFKLAKFASDLIGRGHARIPVKAGDCRGYVKSCYADWAEKSEGCNGVPSPRISYFEQSCVGHSLGGASCAAGKGLAQWRNALGFNPTAALTKPFPSDGSSFRYVFNHDVASLCAFVHAHGFLFGYSNGAHTYNKYAWRTVFKGYSRVFKKPLFKTILKPTALMRYAPIYHSFCTKAALCAGSDHVMPSFRCPEDSYWLEEDQWLWDTKNTKENVQPAVAPWSTIDWTNGDPLGLAGMFGQGGGGQ